jgi:hypothetical protein
MQLTMPVEVHVIRPGDMTIAANRFELYLDFDIRIKARSKAVQTFVVQLASLSFRTKLLVTLRGFGGYSCSALLV